jgi:heterodisulfide reductase subunit D
MSVEGLMTSLCRNCGNCGLGFLKPFEEDELIPQQSGRLICPPYLKYRFQSYRPSGRAVIIDALATGDLELTSEVANEAYTCTLCGCCDEICSEDKVPAFRSLRAELVKAGKGPLPPSKEIDRKIDRTGSIFGGKRERRSAWAKDLNLPKTGEILYFAGCFNSYMFPEVSRATINLLQRSGVDDIAFLGDDEVCCGNHEFLDGQGELGKKQASLLLSAIKECGAKTVITSCSSCYRTFKTDYVEMFGELPFQVFHTTEYLWRSIENGELAFEKEIRKRVTYHDPCGLGRWMRVFEEPRGIIKAIPGVEYVEMQNNRAWSWCCGGGMTVNYFAVEDLANWAAQQRLKEATEAGVDALITACPHCVANFRRAAKQTELGIEILDLAVLADSAKLRIA